MVNRLDFRLHPAWISHTAAFELGWSDIAGAVRMFGDLARGAPDAVRAGFAIDSQVGAVATCGFIGEAAAAADCFRTWTSAFKRAEPRMATFRPDPVGEAWATTSVATDGAFLDGVNDGVADAVARAAVAGWGFGDIEMGLSDGVAARIPMADTAYPLRGTGLSLLVTSEWRWPEDRARSERWVAETGAALRPCARRAYVNYIPPSPPERIREIYGVNYPRLAAIKARYDPGNLIRFNQNILPGVVG